MNGDATDLSVVAMSRDYDLPCVRTQKGVLERLADEFRQPALDVQGEPKLSGRVRTHYRGMSPAFQRRGIGSRRFGNSR